MEEQKTTPNITTLYTSQLAYSADSVEWCPHEPNQHNFVCANYTLIEASQTEDKKEKRIGKVELFSIHPEKKLTLHETIDTPAILDQKWCHNKINDHSILGTVDSANKLVIYKLISDTPKLEPITNIKNDGEDIMMLSLDWSTGKYPSDEPSIVVSDSKGKIHLFKFKNNELEKELTLNAHNYEAWISAFYYWNKSVFFSGGEDKKFLQFDLRVGNDPIFKNTAHSAGVTCIHSNKEKEYLLPTGSLDQKIFLWDLRNMEKPLKSCEMPGTMWRFKWDPQSYNYLLAACMMGKAQIVDFALDEPKIVASFCEEIDTYGIDWSYLTAADVKQFSGEGDRIFASCSAFDRIVDVTRVNLETKDS